MTWVEFVTKTLTEQWTLAGTRAAFATTWPFKRCSFLSAPQTSPIPPYIRRRSLRISILVPGWDSVSRHANFLNPRSIMFRKIGSIGLRSTEFQVAEDPDMECRTTFARAGTGDSVHGGDASSPGNMHLLHEGLVPLNGCLRCWIGRTQSRLLDFHATAVDSARLIVRAFAV